MTRQDQIDARNLERLAVAAERIAVAMDRHTELLATLCNYIDDTGEALKVERGERTHIADAAKRVNPDVKDREYPDPPKSRPPSKMRARTAPLPDNTAPPGD